MRESLCLLQKSISICPAAASPFWRRAGVGLAAGCFALLFSRAALGQPPAPDADTALPKSRLSTDFSKQPMSFEPNVGQTSERQQGGKTLFFSRGAGYQVQLGPTQARLQMDGPARQAGGTITLSYLGANAAVAVSGQQMLPGKHHYIPTSDPKTWHSNVPTYGAVEYRHLYPGVDLSFYGNSDRLEYDFTVAPTGDAAGIKLTIAGAQAVSTDDAGNLVLVSQGRTVRFLKPVAYQNSPGGERRPVEAAYRLDRRGNKSEPVIGFALGEYDHSRPLVIDPVVDYAFYLPATVSGHHFAGASTTDAAGNTYIAGAFSDTDGGAPGYVAGFYVSKYNAAGQQVYDNAFGTTKFPTFQGTVNGIAVDSSGKAYITGNVGGAYGGQLPYTPNAYQTSGGGAFLCVLSADGSTLTYCSYFGIGTAGNGIAVDSSGNVYIAGNVGYYGGDEVPVTPGAPVQTRPSHFGGGFLAKLNPNASGAASLVYSTYIGAPGTYYDTVNSVAVDSAGDAYITGNENGAVYSTTPGAYAYNGRAQTNDVFVSKMNPTGTGFIYSALLGPGAGQAITVDSSNDVYVTGTVYEDDYPTTSGAYQISYPSGFVTELNPAGSALIYSTFLGGPNDHLASGSSYIVPTHLALPPGCSSACNVYVAGYTNGSDLPLVDPVQSYVPGSTWSGFYVELAGDGSSALQSSYIASGSGFDPYQQVPGIGVDSSANIYITGDVLPALFPVTKPVTGPTGEAFLAKIIPASGAKLAATPPSVTFAAQVEGVSTAQQGLANPTVTLQNLGDQPVTLSAIKVSSPVFSQTNNCNGAVPAAGNCTLTLSYTPTTTATQTGTLTFASNATLNPTVQLSGSGKSDSFLLATCDGATECAGLTYTDTVVGGSAPAQVLTVTNLGNATVALTSIVSSLPPDFGVLTNCPLTGGGLAQHKTCQISITFRPAQVGLRPGAITIKWPGTTANSLTIPVTGTGLLSPNPSSLVLLGSMFNFGTVTVGASSTLPPITIFNNGTAPATVFAPTTSTTGDAAGVSDYVITANNCGSLLPQSSCTMTLAFAPTATGTRGGTLTVPTSASSTPLTSNLTGIGVASKQTLEFTPDKITFPDQVIDASSGAATAYVYNVGPTPVYIDRVLISGSYQITANTCSQTTLGVAQLNQAFASCSIQVVFSPTSTGMKTGTVTVIDSEGNQMPLSLAGTGVAQNGLVTATAGTLNFGYLGVGMTSASQSFNVTNIGNIPVTVSGFSTTGDFSAYAPYCTPPYNLDPGGVCGPYLTQFTPTKSANPDNGSFVLTTSVGKTTVNLTGIGEAASKAVILSPSATGSQDFGNATVGTTAGAGNDYALFFYNAGTDSVTLSASPTLSGANASDFSVSLNYCGGANTVIKPGASCHLTTRFTPSAAGSRVATLTFTDDATTGSGIQTISLKGTGTAAASAFNLSPATAVFGPQPVSTSSAGANVTFTNNTASPVTIASVTFQPAINFTRGQNYYGDCNEGAVAANGGKCSVLIYFAPTAAGSLSATATLTDSNGKTYVAKLYGYATPVTDSLYVNPVGLSFAPQPQLSTSGSQSVNIFNQSTQAVAVGQATISNPAFKITTDGCSNTSQRANYGYPCPIAIVFSPTASTALGTQSGTMTIPATYADGKKGSYTITLTGKAVAPVNSAELSPTVFSFYDQPVNSGAYFQNNQQITLTNRSNEALTIGSLTSTNTSSTGPFVVTKGTCGGTLNPGANCYEQINFAPTTAGNGVKGTLTFPITFTNGKTTTLTATYYGNALAAKNSLLITPASGNFGATVVGQTGNVVAFQVTNNGNQSVSFGTATLTSTQAGTNFVRNSYDYNHCSNTTLAVGLSCAFNIYFTPQNAGTINGVLTIADGSSTGGPHKISLVGTGLAASNTIGVSQSAVNFGDVTVGGSGPQQALYVTNLAANAVGSFTYTLGGTNASDFRLANNNCSATIQSRQTCALLLTFAPATASLGTRSASVTIAFGGSTGASIGSPITVNLQGNGVPPAPNVALFPDKLPFTTQAMGTKSGPQYFRLYNTGSANLTVTAFGSTNAAEFAITSNTCSGATPTVTPGQTCLIGVAFAPSAAGPRAGTIQFTDNAKNVAGSKQTVALSGTGVAVPLVTLSPSSVAFGNQNVASTSATQTVTVTNPGAVALSINSIVKAGSSLGDFIESSTCGATLASKATCTVTVQFAPTVAGSRTASIVLSDNATDANGVAQPTQTITLNGTGVGVPSATVSPSSLSFAAGTVGSSSAAMTVTLKNSGTGALAVASVAITGANAADFTDTNGCGTSLAAGAQCSIAVSFTAKAAGARTASLVVTDNSGLVAGSTQSVSLSGTGVQ